MSIPPAALSGPRTEIARPNITGFNFPGLSLNANNIPSLVNNSSLAPPSNSSSNAVISGEARTEDPGNPALAQNVASNYAPGGQETPGPATENKPTGESQEARLLGNGLAGDDVKKLQEMLNGQGHKLELDGIFGPKTEAALKEFQEKAGIKVDGLAGPETRGAFDKANHANEFSGIKPPASADETAHANEFSGLGPHAGPAEHANEFSGLGPQGPALANTLGVNNPSAVDTDKVQNAVNSVTSSTESTETKPGVQA